MGFLKLCNAATAIACSLAVFSHNANAAVTPLVGVNYNNFAACTGPASDPTGVQNLGILQKYPDVRTKVQTQLKAMSASGVQSVGTVINFLYDPTGTVRTDGVINIADKTSYDNFLTSIDQFAEDVKAANIKQLTIRFSALGVGSPLDYVRAWTVPEGAPVPSFDGKYIDINFNFISAVRSKAIAHASAPNFKIYFDLQLEGDTAALSHDKIAATYVTELWRKYTNAYGNSDASFDAVVRDLTNIPNDGFAALIGAYKKSGKPFPKIHMFQFYNDDHTTDYPIGLVQIRNLMNQNQVPADSQQIRIVEGYYSHAPTASSIWHLNNDKGFQITEQLVWPAKYEDYSTGGCPFSEAPPYRVDLELGINKNGVVTTKSGIKNAGLYAPNMSLWVQFWGASGTVPLYLSTYDNTGKLLRSAVNVHGWDTSKLPQVNFPLSLQEYTLLADQGIKVKLWSSDGSSSALYSVPSCGGASYHNCGNISSKAGVAILGSSYDLTKKTISVQFSGAAGVVPKEILVYDSNNRLLATHTSFQWSQSTKPTIYFNADPSELNSLNWAGTQKGRDMNLRLQLKMSDGSLTQIHQMIYQQEVAILAASYDLSKKTISVQFSGKAGTVPKEILVYDSNNRFVTKHSAFQWAQSSTPTIYFSPNASELNSLNWASQQKGRDTNIRLQLKMSDGSLTQIEPLQ